MVLLCPLRLRSNLGQAPRRVTARRPCSNAPCHVLGVFLILSSAAAPASELDLIPQAFVSLRDFEYRANTAQVNAAITSLGVGMTATWRKFYLNLSGEKNFDPGEDQGIELNREDTALSFGYSVNDSISLFTGYKYGQTELALPVPETTAKQPLQLSAQGPFIGAGGGWTVTGRGVFSFSAAYARMEADYFSEDVSHAGQSAGTSLSVQWKANLDKNLHYHLAIIRHDYYYREFDRIPFDITENVLSLRLGLGYRF